MPSSDEQDDAAPVRPTPTGTRRKPKKNKRPKKRHKSNPPDDDVDDADIEMIGLGDGLLEADDSPIKDMGTFSRTRARRTDRGPVIVDCARAPLHPRWCTDYDLKANL